MRKMKRFLSVLLSTVLMFTSAMANINLVTVKADDEMDSSINYCGDNVQWRLEEGVMHIELVDGTQSGAMTNYEMEHDEVNPWNDLRDQITSVIIDDGIENVGARSFVNCRNLESATIPDSVTVVGDRSFQSCEALREVIIGEGSQMNCIEGGAFEGCGSLTEFYVPDGVNDIGSYAFQHTGIKRFTRGENPSKVSVGYDVFTDTPLPTLKGYADINGTVSQTAEVILPLGLAGVTQLIGVDWVYAELEYNGQKYVAIDDEGNVLSAENAIGMGSHVLAAGGADAKIYLDHGDGITAYGVTLLEGENDTLTLDLSEWDYENNPGEGPGPEGPGAPGLPVYENKEGNGTAGDLTWNLAEGVLTITVTDADTQASMTETPWRDGYENSVREIIIGEGVKNIAANAFHHFKLVEKVTIPASVTVIGDRSMQDCNSLAEVSIAENSSLTTIEDGAFEFCWALTEMYIPGQVKRIGSFAFQHTGIERVSQGENASKIEFGFNVFADTKLPTLVLRGMKVTENLEVETVSETWFPMGLNVSQDIWVDWDFATLDVGGAGLHPVVINDEGQYAQLQEGLHAGVYTFTHLEEEGLFNFCFDHHPEGVAHYRVSLSEMGDNLYQMIVENGDNDPIGPGYDDGPHEDFGGEAGTIELPRLRGYRYIGEQIEQVASLAMPLELSGATHTIFVDWDYAELQCGEVYYYPVMTDDQGAVVQVTELTSGIYTMIPMDKEVAENYTFAHPVDGTASYVISISVGENENLILNVRETRVDSGDISENDDLEDRVVWEQCIDQTKNSGISVVFDIPTQVEYFESLDDAIDTLNQADDYSIAYLYVHGQGQTLTSEKTLSVVDEAMDNDRHRLTMELNENSIHMDGLKIENSRVHIQNGSLDAQITVVNGMDNPYANLTNPDLGALVLFSASLSGSVDLEGVFLGQWQGQECASNARLALYGSTLNSAVASYCGTIEIHDSAIMGDVAASYSDIIFLNAIFRGGYSAQGEEDTNSFGFNRVELYNGWDPSEKIWDYFDFVVDEVNENNEPYVLVKSFSVFLNDDMEGDTVEFASSVAPIYYMQEEKGGLEISWFRDWQGVKYYFTSVESNGGNELVAHFSALSENDELPGETLTIPYGWAYGFEATSEWEFDLHISKGFNFASWLDDDPNIRTYVVSGVDCPEYEGYYKTLYGMMVINDADSYYTIRHLDGSAVQGEVCEGTYALVEVGSLEEARLNAEWGDYNFRVTQETDGTYRLILTRQEEGEWIPSSDGRYLVHSVDSGEMMEIQRGINYYRDYSDFTFDSMDSMAGDHYVIRQIVPTDSNDNNECYVYFVKENEAVGEGHLTVTIPVGYGISVSEEEDEVVMTVSMGLHDCSMYIGNWMGGEKAPCGICGREYEVCIDVSYDGETICRKLYEHIEDALAEISQYTCYEWVRFIVLGRYEHYIVPEFAIKGSGHNEVESRVEVILNHATLTVIASGTDPEENIRGTIGIENTTLGIYDGVVNANMDIRTTTWMPLGDHTDTGKIQLHNTTLHGNMVVVGSTKDGNGGMWSSANGFVDMYDRSVIDGNLISQAGQITLYGASMVAGDIYADRSMLNFWNGALGGAVIENTGATNDFDIGYGVFENWDPTSRINRSSSLIVQELDGHTIWIVRQIEQNASDILGDMISASISGMIENRVIQVITSLASHASVSDSLSASQQQAAADVISMIQNGEEILYVAGNAQSQDAAETMIASGSNTAEETVYALIENIPGVDIDPAGNINGSNGSLTVTQEVQINVSLKDVSEGNESGNFTIGSLVYDIDPQIVTIASYTDEDGEETSLSRREELTKLDQSIMITVAIPSAIVQVDSNGDYEPVQVIHNHEGALYFYKAQVTEENGIYYATFRDYIGFSDFELMLNKTQILMVEEDEKGNVVNNPVMGITLGEAEDVSIRFTTQSVLNEEDQIEDIHFEYVIEDESVATVERLENGEVILRAIGTNGMSTVMTIVAMKEDMPLAVEEMVVSIGEEEEEPVVNFSTASLILSGEIGVAFYMNIADEAKDGYMEFSVAGAGGKTTTIQTADITPESDGRYKFICYVNVLQMADTITATYHYGPQQEKSVTKEFSVQGYVQLVMNMVDEGVNLSPKLINLVKAIADYGYYSQVALSQIKGWTMGDAHATMCHYADELVTPDLSEFAYSKEGSSEVITDVTCSASLESETVLNIYFRSSLGDAPIVTVNGSAVQAELQRDGRYKVMIENIGAHKLGRTYQVEINQEITLDVSVLGYAKIVLQTSDSDALKDSMRALYAYYEATMAYRRK